MRKDINITEKNQYRINVKLAGINDITDYIAYGAASHLGCQNHITQFDCQPSESGFTVTIPSLSAGIHQYEVYAKRISSNVEFLLLEGRIEVKNRLSDVVSISNNNNEINADVTFENGEINLAVNVTEGREGPQGERGADGRDGRDGAQGVKGDKGDKGDPFTFSDFTSEQLAALKGDKGDKGDPGEGGGASIDWVQNTDEGVISIGKNQTLLSYSNIETENSIVIGNNTTCADVFTWPSGTFYNVVIGNDAYSYDYYNTVIGHAAGTVDDAQYSICVGYRAEANTNSVSIGSNSWTSNNALAIGNQAYSDSYGLAIGNQAQAGYGEITLKSGYVEVKFSADGMTINGNSIGGGSSGDSSGGGLDMSVFYSYLDKYSKYEYYYSIREDYPYEYDPNSGNSYYRYMLDINEAGEWNFSLENLTEGTSLFNTSGQEKLIKFSSRLSKLSQGQEMFSNCTNLKEFNATLPSLQYGYYMFGYEPYNCTKLNIKSIENIANSLPWGNGGDLYIGMENSLQYNNGDGEYDRCLAALQKIRDKGWTVYEIYSANF